MKRGGFLKRTRLKRKSPLKRKGRLNPINRTRKERRWRTAFGTPHRVAWMKGKGCDVPGCYRRDVECAHVTSRAAGGTYRQTIPLCARHHAAQHSMGVKTFEALFGIDMAERARYWDEMYEFLFPHLMEAA